MDEEGAPGGAEPVGTQSDDAHIYAARFRAFPVSSDRVTWVIKCGGMQRPPGSDPTRDRVDALEREIRALRGPPPIPSSPPPPLPPDKARSVLVLLAESAVHHVTLREFDEARRAIAEAILVMPDVRDPVLVAKASLHIGEALVGLDAPKHAQERLLAAIAALEKMGEARLVARAKVALGRALAALEDPTALDVLMEAKRALIALNDAAGVAHVDATIRELSTQSASKIEVGYNRPVSVVPPKP